MPHFKFEITIVSSSEEMARYIADEIFADNCPIILDPPKRIKD